MKICPLKRDKPRWRAGQSALSEIISQWPSPSGRPRGGEIDCLDCTTRPKPSQQVDTCILDIEKAEELQYITRQVWLFNFTVIPIIIKESAREVFAFPLLDRPMNWQNHRHYRFLQGFVITTHHYLALSKYSVSKAILELFVSQSLRNFRLILSPLLRRPKLPMAFRVFCQEPAPRTICPLAACPRTICSFGKDLCPRLVSVRYDGLECVVVCAWKPSIRDLLGF